MGKIRSFVSKNKKTILGGTLVISIITAIVMVNNSDFIKGCHELIRANEEGCLDRDF